VRRNVGMVFQRANPFPAMSIRDNVVAGLKLNGVRDNKLLDEACEKSLRGANLWDEVKDRLDKPGGGLSGGQQQRVAVVRAVASRPAVLLADEPTASLDDDNRWAVEKLLQDYLDDGGTIIMASHQPIDLPHLSVTVEATR